MPKPKPLYRLPKIVDAETIWVAEGEKCADVLVELGLCGTTWPGGANAWHLADWTPLAGKVVVILPDADEPGRKAAEGIARTLHGLGCEVRIVEIPGLPDGGDIADAIEWREWRKRTQSENRAALDALADNTPAWVPPGGTLKAVEGDDNTTEPREGKKKVGKKSGPSLATQLVELGKKASELFHDPDDEPYAIATIDGMRRTFPLRSKAFRTWLAGLLYGKTKRAPGSQALQDALVALSAVAIHEGKQHAVHVRLAGHDGHVFIDLVNDRHEVIHVTPSSWRVISSADCPLRFIRRKGMRPLPRPQSGGSIEKLRQYMNLPDDSAWHLAIAWLVGAFQLDGPYPILMLSGEQGSAKSTTARILRALVDPNDAPLRSKPREERDLAIAASNSWVVAFDNVSDLSPWLSDALCRVATGGGFTSRELYSDAEETILSFKRPAILNGIGSFADRPDLLDRAIHLHLPSVPERKRRDERTLWAAFDRDYAKLFGAVLNAVSAALAGVDNVELDRLPRMADFARWVAAAEPALPWDAGAFLAAYSENRAAGDRTALEASAIGPVLIALVDRFNGAWRGTYGGLLAALNSELDGDDGKPKRLPPGWPKAPNKLSTALSRIAPSLRAIGYSVSEETVGWAKTKIVAIAVGDQQETERNRPPAYTASPANRTGAAENADSAGDTRVIDGLSPEINPPHKNRDSEPETTIAGHAVHAGDQIHPYSCGDDPDEWGTIR